MEILPRQVITVSKYELDPFIHGRRVGCYMLGRTIGEGSFAKVKEAIHIVTGEKVAVKIIDKKRARDDRYISKNLRREARILQLVRHPNIIQLFEVLETDNFYYLVVEYCAGGELLDFICSQKRLEESIVKKLLSQLVSAVDTMHNSGIVHRDLKIENFLLNDNQDLKIIDFGLSNTMSSACLIEYEKTGVFPQLLNTHCGSPAYAAPELLAQKRYGPQVDIWSIGINMYAMLTGFLPYMMEPFNVMDMYEKMMQRKMTPVPGFLSKECRDLLIRLLEPVPEWRITLKQVIKHRWFSGTSIPRPLSLGDNMYHKKELCESVLNYMKYDLKINMTDTINAVISNRAVHSSSIYHLLVRRLDRYMKTEMVSQNSISKFSKVEVIKKANLKDENASLKSNNKVKRFSFRGRKIDQSSRSQPAIMYDLISEKENRKNSYSSQSSYTGNSYVGSMTTNNKLKDSEKEFHESRKAKEKNGKVIRHHKRSASSANSEHIDNFMRKSLLCDSQEKRSMCTQQSTDTKLSELYNPEMEESLITTRKLSFDCLLDEPIMENERKINIQRYLHGDKSSIVGCKQKKTRSIVKSDEGNVREGCEQCPGWLITKIIKQRPLKDENNIRDEVQKRSNEMIDLISSNIDVHEISPTCQKNTDDMEQTIDNFKALGISLSPNTLSQRLQSFDNRRTRTLTKTPEAQHGFHSSDDETKPTLRKSERSRDSPTPELDEILQNVRFINKHHLEQRDRTTDVENFLTNQSNDSTLRSHDNGIAHTLLDSKIRISPGDIPISRKPKTDSDLEDGNNNILFKKRVGTPNKGLVKKRMARLECLEKEIVNKPVLNSTINKIAPTKKTLELIVKQFAQFKADDKSPHIVPSVQSTYLPAKTTVLKPLEINFNFKLQRKKKAYKQKQQTRSLTDIVKIVSNNNTTGTSGLSSNQCIDANTDISKQVQQGKILNFNPINKHSKKGHHASMSLVESSIPEDGV